MRLTILDLAMSIRVALQEVLSVAIAVLWEVVRIVKNGQARWTLSAQETWASWFFM